jgi:hypothetical protein
VENIVIAWTLNHNGQTLLKMTLSACSSPKLRASNAFTFLDIELSFSGQALVGLVGVGPLPAEVAREGIFDRDGHRVSV